ncbi:MerR family transcriptional regulator [Agromyces neolithicus]
MSELSTVTGVPVPTLKYYLREGLLHAGHRQAPNQAQYDDSHVARVRLLRVLREVGGVPVARLRELVAAVDGVTTENIDAMRAAAYALSPVPPRAGPDRQRAREIATAVIEAAGWARVSDDAPDRENLAAAIEVIVGFGTHEDRLSIIDEYARVADAVARFEVADLDAAAPRDALLAQLVVGQVVFGEMLASLRRLAEEHHSAVRFETE